MKIFKFLAIPALALAICLTIASPVLAADALPFVTNLEITDGQTSQVIGEVTVTNYGSIIFRIDEANTPWRLTKTQVYIGDNPPDKIKPDKYNFQHIDLGGVSSDGYEVDLAPFDINGDGIVFIGACAELIDSTPLLKSGKKPANTESAWAKGDQSSGKGKNYKSFFSVYWWNIG